MSCFGATSRYSGRSRYASPRPRHRRPQHTAPPPTSEGPMSNFPCGRTGALALVIILSACKDGGKDPLAPRALRDEAVAAPELALAAAPVSTLLGRATFSDPHERNLDIKRITGDWHVQIKAKPALDIAVQSIAFPAGSQSTWHSHPGPVF